MADAMETTRNAGIPVPPPLQHVAPVVHMPDEGDDQNRPPASELSAIGASTTPIPPPSKIRVQVGSAVSSITNTATSSSEDAVNGDDTNDTPRKQHGGSSQIAKLLIRRLEARHDCRRRHSEEDVTSPSHHRCRPRHHRPTPASLLWTTAAINDENAVRQKNVP